MAHLNTYSAEDQARMLRVARKAILHGLAERDVIKLTLSHYPGHLRENGASFVTLTTGGRLRGCIGALRAYQPLIQDVAEHAFAAAFKDARFSPLQEEELSKINIHISILNPAEKMQVTSEQDLLTQLRPGVDGLIIKDGALQATFLPSVWKQLSDPAEFLLHLKHKAGMGSDHWSGSMECYRYTVTEFGE
ncbi:MAG: AmmeMemoRadiSam system protein A [Gammaproteobacteria bacterium]